MRRFFAMGLVGGLLALSGCTTGPGPALPQDMLPAVEGVGTPPEDGEGPMQDRSDSRRR